MNVAGLFATIFSLIFLKGKIHVNGLGLITEIGDYWGGVSLGLFALSGRYKDRSTYIYNNIRKHEFGHSLQNAILGPLFIFIVAIPSMIRYFYSNKHTVSFDWYESVWFENTATKYGTKFVDYIEK